MQTTAIAVLAALALAGPVLADEPAPATPLAAAKVDATAKPAQKRPDAKRAPGAGAHATPPKAGEAAKKDPPCEPVKPCPIE